MNRFYQALTCLLLGMVVLVPSRSHAHGGGGGQSYTSVGAAQAAFDPPTQFVGGFAQMYQPYSVPLTPVAPAPAVASAPAQFICVPAVAAPMQSPHPIRWVRRVR